MSNKTGIEWTDITDNIIVAANGGWWCRKCSEGCDNCYAEDVNDSNYFKGNHLPYSGRAPVMALKRSILAGWARQRLPKRHFVASMTDVFGEWVLKDWCFEFLDAMAAAPLQTFQVLTKRARRMSEIVNEWLELRGREIMPANIQLGVSVENQKSADVRIPHLLAIPCPVRFLSCEPLVDEVSLNQWLSPEYVHLNGDNNALEATQISPAAARRSVGIGWVIVGGESGHNEKIRPMHPDWARNLRDQCQSAGVPFLFKQWGVFIEIPALQKKGDFEFPDPEHKFRPCFMRRVHKKLAGRIIDGGTWDEFPTVSSATRFVEEKSVVLQH